MTDRRILTSNIDTNTDLRQRIYYPTQHYAHIKAQCCNLQKTVSVPIYICASMKELVQVNLADRKVKASFIFHVSVYTDIKQQEFVRLGSNEISSSWQLRQFIENNLKLEIGEKFIDIFHMDASTSSYPNKTLDSVDDRVKLRESLRRIESLVSLQQRSISIEEEQQQIIDESYNLQTEQLVFQDQFFTKKLLTSHQARCTNHFISGIFDCECQLDSKFFPYHQIYSNLKIRVDDQYYKDVKVKYNLIFPKEYLQSNQQFYFIFPSLKQTKFGIYSIDLAYHEVNYESLLECDDEISCNYYTEVTNINFCFKIISFNIPFICRNQIPLWNLCFATLMLYFARNQNISAIYGNIILLSVSFIFLVTNFRRSKYRSSTMSLYEFTITSFIVANFLLIIHSTNNFYGENNEISDINTSGPFLLISIGLTSLSLFFNIIIMLIFAIKYFSPGKYFPDKSRQLLQDIWIEPILSQNPTQNLSRPYYTRQAT